LKVLLSSLISSIRTSVSSAALVLTTVPSRQLSRNKEAA